MMFYTNILPYQESKQLLSCLQKPGRQGKWRNHQGDDGVEMEVSHEDLSREDLSSITLPPYCASMDILGEQYASKEKLPKKLFIDQDEWLLWEGGARRYVVAAYMSKRMGGPISVRFDYDNEGKYFGRKQESTTEFSISFGKLANYGSRLPQFDCVEWDAEKPEVIAGIGYYQEKYGLPETEGDGLLELRKYSVASYEYRFEPAHVWWMNYDHLMRSMCADDADGEVFIASNTYTGGTSTVCNGPKNILSEAQKKLNCAIASHYVKFSVDYTTVKPENWSAREKRRKKWNKPILQDLGNLEFKGIGNADVRVRIEKNGYVFILDFDTEDSAFAFPDSLLFKKADWLSESE